MKDHSTQMSFQNEAIPTADSKDAFEKWCFAVWWLRISFTNQVWLGVQRHNMHYYFFKVTTTSIFQTHCCCWFLGNSYFSIQLPLATCLVYFEHWGHWGVWVPEWRFQWKLTVVQPLCLQHRLSASRSLWSHSPGYQQCKSPLLKQKNH